MKQYDSIQHLACNLYLNRKEQGLPGNQLTDWLEAEEQYVNAKLDEMHLQTIKENNKFILMVVGFLLLFVLLYSLFLK